MRRYLGGGDSAFRIDLHILDVKGLGSRSRRYAADQVESQKGPDKTFSDDEKVDEVLGAFLSILFEIRNGGRRCALLDQLCGGTPPAIGMPRRGRRSGNSSIPGHFRGN